MEFFFPTFLGYLYITQKKNQSIYKNIVYQKILSKIIFVYFIFLIIFFVFFPIKIYLLISYFLFFPFVICLIEKIYKIYWMKKFRKDLLEILNVIILQMFSGCSFRDALRKTCDESKDHQFILKEILNFVVFLQQKNFFLKDKFLEEVFREFKLIDQNPHMSIKRLKSYRNKIRIENKFYLKSGQALKQVKIQSLIMSFMYFALLIVVISYQGFWINFKLIIFSLLLYSLGTLVIYYSNKCFRWKV